MIYIVFNYICLLTTVFNVGEYRRKAAPHSISSSDFFRPDNKDAQEIREYDVAYCYVQTATDLDVFYSLNLHFDSLIKCYFYNMLIIVR